MKKCYRCKEIKEFSEFNKSKNGQYGLAFYCKTCSSKISKEWRDKNPEKYRSYKEKTRAKNPERTKETEQKWRKDNPEKAKAAAKRWHEANPNKNGEYVKIWRKNNPGRHSAAVSKRKAAQLKRTPPWLSKEQANEITNMYETAHELRWLSEVPLHVDHIIPLNGKNVSGLHVPWNLQILPASLNMSKRNKFDYLEYNKDYPIQKITGL